MTPEIQHRNLFPFSSQSSRLCALKNRFDWAALGRGRIILSFAALVFLGVVWHAPAQEADLAILDFTFSPQSIDAGGHPTNMTYSFGNAGPDDIDADSAVSKLVLSRNSILGDADDVRIWEREQFFGLLAAGEVFNFTSDHSTLAEITIPSDASGSYYLFYRVDHAASSSYSDPDLSNNHLRLLGKITVNPITPPHLTGAPVSNQGFQVIAAGLAGRMYRFEGSIDLKTWDQLSTVVADGTDTAKYLDPAASGRNYRFYRAALLPP